VTYCVRHTSVQYTKTDLLRVNAEVWLSEVVWFRSSRKSDGIKFIFPDIRQRQLLSGRFTTCYAIPFAQSFCYLKGFYKQRIHAQTISILLYSTGLYLLETILLLNTSALVSGYKESV
jgi:hypothetical protein